MAVLFFLEQVAGIPPRARFRSDFVVLGTKQSYASSDCLSFTCARRQSLLAPHLVHSCPFDSLTNLPQKEIIPLQGYYLFLEQVAGIEPASSGWKPEIIAIIRYPHSFASRSFSEGLVGLAGLEPTTSWSQTMRSTY